jgi:hypothetical protein
VGKNLHISSLFVKDKQAVHFCTLGGLKASVVRPFCIQKRVLQKQKFFQKLYQTKCLCFCLQKNSENGVHYLFVRPIARNNTNRKNTRKKLFNGQIIRQTLSDR